MEFLCRFFENSYYECTVEKISWFSTEPDTVIFTGIHKEGKGNEDVDRLVIDSVPLEVIPRNLYKIFPNLQVLVIEACNLKKITKDDLFGLGELNILSLQCNNLTSLPVDLFENTRKVERIFLSDNKIERVSSKMFAPLDKIVVRCDFRRNSKINVNGHINAFHGVSIDKMMEIIDALKDPEPEYIDTKLAIPQISFVADRKTERLQQLNRNFTEQKSLGEFTDFVIRTREKEYKVHRNILASQSLVFRQMFLNDDQKIEQEFAKIKRFSDDSFGGFLNFFYTGVVDNKANIMEIFELAAVFNVVVLKGICITEISETLRLENSLEAYSLGIHHNCQELQQPAQKVIKSFIPEIDNNMMKNIELVEKLIASKLEFEALLKSNSKMV